MPHEILRTTALTLGLLVATGQTAWAQAHTLAVLPLEKATGSAQYDGLGTALSGMIVADLSGLDAIALVERARLDTLMGEMKLSESGFLDPKTAQTLGKGLGAEYVLTGTFSVVDPTFALDARIVRVESGAILEAAAASGTVSDFVSVEKDLVEKILGELEVSLSTADKRQLYVQAPTERFDAFARYGEGLAREEEGKLEDAKAAFEAALALDPEFEAARAALSGLRSVVEEERARHEARASETASAADAAILAAYPDERTRGKGFEDDKYTAAGFALRLMVLENEGRHCQRLEEMWHYAERKDWRIEEPPRGDTEGVFSYIVGQEAEKHGFGSLDRSIIAPPAAYEGPTSRAYTLFRTTYDFVFDDTAQRPYEDGSGIIGAMRGCLPPEEQLARIEEIERVVRKADLGAQMQDRNPKADWTFAEALTLHWAWTHAISSGASDEVTRRTKEVIEGRAEDDWVRKVIARRVEEIAEQADAWEEHTQRRVGRSPEQLLALEQAIAKEDTSILSKDTPVCAYALAKMKPGAEEWVAEYPEKKRGHPNPFAGFVDRKGADYGTLRDLGCIRGTPPRFASDAELVAFTSSVGERLDPAHASDPTCKTNASTVASILTPDTLEALKAAPTRITPMLVDTLHTYYGSVVYFRCVYEK